jgi:hypothetical protein
MKGWYVNDELESIWKEADIHLEGLKKTTKNLI